MLRNVTILAFFLLALSTSPQSVAQISEVSLGKAVVVVDPAEASYGALCGG